MEYSAQIRKAKEELHDNLNEEKGSWVYTGITGLDKTTVPTMAAVKSWEQEGGTVTAHDYLPEMAFI